MSFVNEFVKEEDVLAYRLDELLRSFSPWSWREGRPSTFNHSWTIDRESGVFLVLLGQIEEVGQSGRLQPTTKNVFHLHLGNNANARVILDRSKNQVGDSKGLRYRILWKIIELNLDPVGAVSRESLLKILHDALTVYGIAGVYQANLGTEVQLELEK